jgi:hypothetical protein
MHWMRLHVASTPPVSASLDQASAQADAFLARNQILTEGTICRCDVCMLVLCRDQQAVTGPMCQRTTMIETSSCK